jgi:N-acyl-D-aspartate/D-glutamate deacylase
MFDIVIRDGTIIDGSGGEPYRADLAINDGGIVAIGADLGPAKEVIDAGGCIVTPGFVDIHTHYDAQITWSEYLGPSTDHGTTTVVMGNCAVGIAPCRPADRERLIEVMAGVEDIPEAVLAEGVPWNWESFPEYLDALDARHADADFAAMLAHAPLRVYVMGKRGADREPANAADLLQMKALVRDAIDAGAIGFSTSRSLVHRDVHGALAPAETASEEELMTIAAAVRDAQPAVLEYITDFPGLGTGGRSDFDLMCRFAQAAERPLSFTLSENPAYPEGFKTLLKLTEEANEAGVELRGQIAPRAVGILFGLDLSYHPFSFRPSYQAIADLPLDERVAAMRKPDVRARILGESDVPGHPFAMQMTARRAELLRLGNPPNYEPDPSEQFARRAAATGQSVDEIAYDELLENNGRALLYMPVTNYVHGNLDTTLTMMRHPHTVIGLGDGGAHVGMICDAAYPTFVLAHWTRDRKGEQVPLPTMVRMLTRDPAEAVGLRDRGLLAPGYKADVNVINLDDLAVCLPEVSYDLPTGGRRLFQRSKGYIATLVSGVITRRHDKRTGALPGRLVRGLKPAPGA